MATEFGKRVAAARKRAGFTQKTLAPRVGMSQSNLSELETVAHESGKTAQIARACSVDAYWLATGDGEMLASGNATPQPRAQPLTLQSALPVVLDALEGLGPTRWTAVRAVLDQVVSRPDLRDEAQAELVHLLLTLPAKAQRPG